MIGVLLKVHRSLKMESKGNLDWAKISDKNGQPNHADKFLINYLIKPQSWKLTWYHKSGNSIMMN